MSDDPQALLAQVDLFAGLSARHLKKVVGRARVVPHTAGQTISAEGFGALAFHLVLSGEVTVSAGGRIHGPNSIQWGLSFTFFSTKNVF